MIKKNKHDPIQVILILHSSVVKLYETDLTKSDCGEQQLSPI